MLVRLDCGDMITNIDRMDMLGEVVKDYTLAQIRDFINSIQAAGEQLRQNANPRLVLEVLMLDMPGKEGRSRKSLATSLS